MRRSVALTVIMSVPRAAGILEVPLPSLCPIRRTWNRAPRVWGTPLGGITGGTTRQTYRSGRSLTMNRSSGAGLLGLGIVLVVVGAILEFAVTATAKGFSVHTVGIILLWVGIVAFVLGLVFMITGGS